MQSPITDLPGEIPVQVLNELDKLQDGASIIPPLPCVEDILNDLMDLDDDSVDLSIIKSVSIEDVLNSLDPLISVASPLSVGSHLNESWNILEYNDCDADSSINASWDSGEVLQVDPTGLCESISQADGTVKVSENTECHYDGKGLQTEPAGQSDKMSQVDENLNELGLECSNWDADASNKNISRTFGEDVVQAHSELTYQLEKLKGSGHVDCDVYTSSSGTVQNIGMAAVRTQQDELKESPQQYIVVCSGAHDTPKMHYECDVCMKSIRWKWHFVKHTQNHIAPRRYECEVCHKSFSKKLSLSEHLNLHTGTRLYQCDVCQMTFPRRGSLKQHLKTHFDVSRFQCELCQGTFSSKGNLNDHLKVHSDVRPHQCKVCGKSFRFKRCLSIHAKIH